MRLSAPPPMKILRDRVIVYAPRDCIEVEVSLVQEARKRSLTRASFSTTNCCPQTGEHAKEN